MRNKVAQQILNETSSETKEKVWKDAKQLLDDHYKTTTLEQVVKEFEGLGVEFLITQFNIQDYTKQELPYGKYLVVRKDGKIHFEVYNGTGWAYNDNSITHFYLPAVR